MIQLFIALAAGCASALMFASIASGALISLVLFYLAPLPLMIAALGWGALTSLISGVAASIMMGTIFGLPYMLAFFVTIALPAWWLGYLALLAKPTGGPIIGPTEPMLDWYPPGRLLIWAAAFASITTITALLSLGYETSTITGTLKRSLTHILGMRDIISTDADTDKFITILVTIAPAAATLVATITLILNLWLAGKVTQASGQLPRPWPALNTIEFPPMTLAVLFIAIALCFNGSLIALFSQVVAAALMMSYAFVGFAVLHTFTQAAAMRGLWLGSTYAAVMVFGWPLLIIALIGIADALFGFRRRKAHQI